MDAVSKYQDLGDKMRLAGDHSAVARGLSRLIREKRADFQGMKVAEEMPVNPDGKPRAYVLTPVLDKRVDGYSKIGRYLI